MINHVSFSHTLHLLHLRIVPNRYIPLVYPDLLPLHHLLEITSILKLDESLAFAKAILIPQHSDYADLVLTEHLPDFLNGIFEPEVLQNNCISIVVFFPFSLLYVDLFAVHIRVLLKDVHSHLSVPFIVKLNVAETLVGVVVVFYQ